MAGRYVSLSGHVSLLVVGTQSQRFPFLAVGVSRCLVERRGTAILFHFWFLFGFSPLIGINVPLPYKLVVFYSSRAPTGRSERENAAGTCCRSGVACEKPHDRPPGRRTEFKAYPRETLNLCSRFRLSRFCRAGFFLRTDATESRPASCAFHAYL